jgi:hypothetical protein
LAGTCGRCTAQSMMPPESPRRDLRRISLPRGLPTLMNARRRPCSACCLHKASLCGQPLEAPLLADEGFGTQLRRLYVAGELRTESVQGGSAYRGWTSDERTYELLSRLLHTSVCAATQAHALKTREKRYARNLRICRHFAALKISGKVSCFSYKEEVPGSSPGRPTQKTPRFAGKAYRAKRGLGCALGPLCSNPEGCN